VRWFVNLSTRTKLFVSFGLMVGFLAATMLVALRSIDRIQASQRTLFDDDFTVAMELAELRNQLTRQRSQLLEMSLTTDLKAQEAIERDIRDRAGAIDVRLAAMSAAKGCDPRLLAELTTILRESRQARNTEFALIYEGKLDQARQLTLGAQDERFDRIHQLCTLLESNAKERARAGVVESQRRADDTLRVFQTIGGTVLGLAVVLAWSLSRITAHPLKRISDAAERVASGDLTVSLPVERRADEVGRLGRTFGKMVESLRGITTELSEGVGVLAASASQIVASSTQLASGSAQTATAVGETTTTVEEVRQTAQVATQKAKYVSDSAQNASTIAQTGRKNTEATGEGMGRIREQMDSIAQSMMRLSEQTQAIGQIITTVDDLAQQSNLLAVNASIEAAKAGEQGRGFAVVAQEVKSLAEQSKAATTQVRTILNDIQKATGAAVMATEQGAKAVEAGGRQSVQAGESILALANSVAEAAQAATQIAASSQQQLIGMDQVAVAMESIKQASNQNVDSAKQLEQAAHNLDGLGRRLRELIAKFEV